MKDNSWQAYMNKSNNNQIKGGKNQSTKTAKGNQASAKQMNRRTQ